MVKINIEIFLRGSNASRTCSDTDEVYDCVMALTNGYHSEAARVQGWADLAHQDEVYEGENFIAVCN